MEATGLNTSVNHLIAAGLALLLISPTATASQTEKQETQEEQTSEHKLEQELDTAYAHFLDGRPDLVIATLEPIAMQHPENAELAFFLFDSYTAIGLFEQGEKWLRIALERGDDFDYSMLANFYSVTGNNDALVEILNSYREDDEQSAEFYKSLGIAAAGAGKYEIATHFFEKSAARSDEPFLNLHYALSLRELGHPKEANAIIEAREKKIRELLEEKPDDKFGHYVLGEIHALRGNPEKAVSALRHAVGKQLSYYFYWTLSDSPGSDGMWDKVREHPEFQAYLNEKHEQILESRAKLDE